eukprot:3156841-Pyramimonas_sp.AAC.1
MREEQQHNEQQEHSHDRRTRDSKYTVSFAIASGAQACVCMALARVSTGDHPGIDDSAETFALTRATLLENPILA